METKLLNLSSLLIKIGLGLFIIGGLLFVVMCGLVIWPSTPSTTTTESITPDSQIATSPTMVKSWEVANLSYEITEQNNSWWRFSWQCTLTNQTTKIMDFFIVINFLDKKGFIIDDTIENPPIFAPHEERIVRGYGLVDTSLAHKVCKIEAMVTGYAQ